MSDMPQVAQKLSIAEYRHYAEVTRAYTDVLHTVGELQTAEANRAIQESCDHIHALCDEVIFLRRKVEGLETQMIEHSRELTLHVLALRESTDGHVKLWQVRQSLQPYMPDSPSGEIERV